MIATVLKFADSSGCEERKKEKALAMMQEYYKVFHIADLERRQEAFAVWHAKAMNLERQLRN